MKDAQEILVSCIVPIFNSENYLDSCIESIVSQTYKNLDIILVNDGSTDKSLNICEEYAQSDTRIRIYTQKNLGGGGCARKNGTYQARGAYIVYVDADDKIDNTYIEKLVTINRKQEFDLVISQFISSNGDIYQDCLPCGKYTQKQIIDLSIDGEKDFIKYLMGFMHGKLYKKNIALAAYGKIDSTVVLGEDQDFGLSYLLYCNYIYIADFCEYHYTVRSSSLSHVDTNQERWLQDLGKIYVSMKKNIERSVYKNDLDKYLKKRFFETYLNMLSLLGFTFAANFPIFDIPDSEKIMKGSIVLYGAGRVGKDYFLQLSRRGIKPVLWVADNYVGERDLEYKVSPVSDILLVKYDYILIAEIKRGVAEQMRRKLIAMHIPQERIIDEKPLSPFYRI